jgi:transcriptional regulator with XRE-family HTH domain
MDDMDKLKRNIGTALLGARERAGLTQADVASLVGLAPAVYGRIERGHMLPSVPTLHRLCVALRISANVLLGLDAEEPHVRMPLPHQPAEPPELRRLALILPTLSSSALHTLAALASAIALKKREAKSAPPP